MEAKRLLLRNLIRTAISLSSNFSSYSSAAALPNKKWQLSTADPSSTPAVKSQPLKTVQWNEALCNSASFIGTVMRPVQKFDTSSGFGAVTSLLVKPPSNPDRSFRIFLKMWDEIAEMSLNHIKQNDFLHVSGRVESYTKTDENNISQTFYGVVVKEINYVAPSEHSPTRKNAQQLDSKGDKSGIEIYRARLQLWQLLFSNPSEWHDMRKKKAKPNHPDFKHKDTGEALWINTSDPPWVKAQLQLLDSKFTKQDHKEGSCSSFSSFI